MAAASNALVVTRTAPTNIATIKYWGKRDTSLNLPINSSVSVTLNQDDLKAMTTVVASKEFTADRLWLNGTCVHIQFGSSMFVIFVASASLPD